MRMTDFFSKQCCLGSIGLILAGFGTLFAVFWLDFLETQIINVSLMASQLVLRIIHNYLLYGIC